VTDTGSTSSAGQRRPSSRVGSETVLVALLLLLALAARLVPGERVVDDAYITFRYARSLVDGVGFVYNPGERVLGTTTPLYTVLLASLSLATGVRDFAQLAVLANSLFGALSVGLLYGLAKRLSGHSAPAFAAALLWAIAPYSVTFAIGGMETDLVVALLVGAALAHLASRGLALAVLSALALLARPDTGILIGLLWLDRLLLRHRRVWRDALVAAALLAPWAIFATWYFGSPLTSSIAAKADAYLLPPAAAGIRLLQHYATPFLEQLLLPAPLIVAVFAVYCGLCFLAGRRALLGSRRAWPSVAYPFAYALVFAVANPLLFRWYLSPPLPFYFVLITAGFWALGNDLARSLAARSRGSRRGSWVAVVPLALFTTLALICTLNGWEIHPDHGPDRPAPEMAWFELELLYGQAADFLLTTAHPGDTLCAGDIGVLGYRTGLRVLDTVGLVTPASSAYYPADPAIYVTNYAIPADLVKGLNPNYVVILEVYGRLGLLPDPGFRSSYSLLNSVDTDIYGSEGMLVFGQAVPSSDPDPADE
jgi:hypothetical protein